MGETDGIMRTIIADPAAQRYVANTPQIPVCVDYHWV